MAKIYLKINLVNNRAPDQGAIYSLHYICILVGFIVDEAVALKGQMTSDSIQGIFILRFFI